MIMEMIKFILIRLNLQNDTLYKDVQKTILPLNLRKKYSTSLLIMAKQLKKVIVFRMTRFFSREPETKK